MTITDIVNKIYFLTKTDSTQFEAADMLILINNAYNRAVSLINNSDNRWQWDDANQTDFPIATTALVSGQQDYSLATSHLEIIRVELKNASGIWNVLKSRDPQDSSDVSESYRATITGIPYEYDKFASSVFLYPTPNFSQAASLKVYFQRGPLEFTSGEVSTGTKVPGFNSLYHDLIPLWVAYDYWLVNDPAMTTRILNQIQLKENDLKKDYNSRDKDDHQSLLMAESNFM